MTALTMEEVGALPDEFFLARGFTQEEIRALRPQVNELDVKPIAGCEIPWRDWVPQKYLRRDCAPFAPFHELLWDWFDGLVLDQKSESAIVPWARGLGKSTSLEGGIVRTCVKGTRRFCLYVSRTLDDANNHVMAIARVLESMGIGRQVNKYGLATGWNAQRLRTDSGFSILSFGLDAGARGIKLDDFRPDLIALDDIDHIGDSVEMVEKKVRIISNTIMQAGSPSFATIFVQNPIGPHTVFSRVLDGRAGILLDRNRELAKLVPAIYDFTYDLSFGDDGLERATITGGTSSWEGKSLADWQYQINKGGIRGFLIECQHDIHIGSTFFDRFDPEIHITPAIHTPKGVDGPDAPQWWTFFGGFDWGYSDPSAFILAASDENGAVHILESWEIGQLTNDQLADRVCATLARWGVNKRTCDILADRAMWSRKTFNGVQAEADVEAFYRQGLRFIACAHGDDANRHRNSVIRSFLEALNKLKIYRGFNNRLVECLQGAQPQTKDREQVLHNEYSHMIFALGCGMSSRPKPSAAPKRDFTPEEMEAEVKRVAEAVKVSAREEALRARNKAMGLVEKKDDDGKVMRDDNGNIVWTTAKKRR